VLTARPTRIRDAVQALPEPKVRLRKAAPRVDAFRQRLLELSPGELQRMRMRPKALDALPNFASERDNAPLQERVRFLAVRDAARMSWPTAARLFAWLHTDERFRAALGARLEREPPAQGPGWLLDHGRATLLSVAPIPDLVREALATQPVVARLNRHLGIGGGTPLAAAVLDRALSQVRMRDQPYTDTLRWIERSADPWGPRRALLIRLLKRFPASPATLRVRPALRELYSVAHARLGPPDEHPGGWPVACREAGNAVPDLDRLVTPFDPDDDRRDWWPRLAPHVRQVQVVGPVIAFHTRLWVAAERRQASAVRVFAKPAWPLVEAALRDGTALPPPAHRFEDRDALRALLSG
jgi:hypothetical protein